MSRRTDRIEEQLRGELARLLRSDVADPRVGLVTVTRVDVAPDLTTALVFWSALEGPHQPSVDDVAEGLRSAAGFLRTRLARVLRLRRVPELRFRHDPSLKLGSETLELLRSLSDEPSP